MTRRRQLRQMQAPLTREEMRARPPLKTPAPKYDFVTVAKWAGILVACLIVLSLFDSMGWIPRSL